ncbi:MAG: NAD(P)H-dependent oxidoreductase [Treponemataceae bacterium]|nr:NAD(P)H-dependent oxidoreductase [Spirochaetales bacterium]MDY6031813.1 NAD(P)H-dependent oxidoreductase [Treponemataceae bacterium]
MSQTIIVYYSLEGNIDFVAKTLAEKISCSNVVRLETVKAYPTKGLFKFLHGGKDAIKGFKPELKTELPDLSKFDNIVIATPVWASRPSAPISSFIEKCDFTGKKVFIIASSAGGSAESTIEAINNEVTKKGATVVASVSFVNLLKQQDKVKSGIDEFVSKVN